MTTWIRDLLRGFRDEDLESVARKIAEETWPGRIVPVTARELKAHLAVQRALAERMFGP